MRKQQQEEFAQKDIYLAAKNIFCAAGMAESYTFHLFNLWWRGEQEKPFTEETMTMYPPQDSIYQANMYFYIATSKHVLFSAYPKQI